VALTKKIAAAALALTLASVAGAAQAAVYTVTMTGVVDFGFDEEGFFGGGDLIGKTIYSQFTIDTSKGVYEDFTAIGVVRQSGGGLSNPISSSVQIQGLPAFNLGSRETGFVENVNALFGNTYRIENFGVSSFGIGDIGYNHAFEATALVPDAIPGLSIEPRDFGSLPNVAYRGSFVAYRGVPGSKSGVEGQRTSYANYTITSFTAAAVPEPQIWAMLVIGFGVTGVALQQGRRARAKTALAT
jgi:hypothetical protein